MGSKINKIFGLSSFTNLGHIIHINLKEQHLPIKNEIGKALLEQHKRAAAVVNKVDTINNEFRNFQLEIIAKREGETRTDDELLIVEVNQNNCRFKFDFSKVYWNTRLSTEHERMINMFQKGLDVVFDIFAGVGPFSVPAAKSKCRVYANDLNPESIKWLEVNILRNKLDRDKIKVFNLDAKDFILGDLKNNLLNEYKRVDEEITQCTPDFHFLMNLPAIAMDFLINFVGLLRDQDQEKLSDVQTLFRRLNLKHIVHCYCFLKGKFDKPADEIRKMAEEKLGRKLKEEQILSIVKVRNVAPYKNMYRIDFILTESILFDMPDAKRCKITVVDDIAECQS